MASKKPKEEAEARLEELEVREVSIVDRPAIKRRFLFLKRDAGGSQEGDMPKPKVTTEEISLLDILGLGDDEETKGEPEDTSVAFEDIDLEAINKSELEAIGKVAAALVGKLSKTVSTLKDASAEQEKEAAGEVAAIAKATTILAGKLGYEAKGEPEKAEDTLLKTASAALKRLMAVSGKLKAIKAEEVPTAIVSELGAVGGLLTTATKAEEQESDPEPEPDKQKTTKAEPKLRLFIARGDDDDPEIVIKAGAKMKRTRLNQFKKAVETLMSLLHELEGGDDGGKDAKDKKKGVKKAEDGDSINEKLVKGFELLESKMTEKIEAAVKAALEPVTKRLDEIDATVPPGNGDADATETEPEKVEKKEGLWSSIFRH